MSVDITHFKDFARHEVDFLLRLSLDCIPLADISSCIVRIFSDELEDEISVLKSFQVGGVLSDLKIQDHQSSILISSDSQETGREQHFFI